jgi:hypothetical protein
MECWKWRIRLINSPVIKVFFQPVAVVEGELLANFDRAQGNQAQMGALVVVAQVEDLKNLKFW